MFQLSENFVSKILFSYSKTLIYDKYYTIPYPIKRITK